MAAVEVDKNDKPRTAVKVIRCGELERKKKASQPLGETSREVRESRVSSTERGRRKHRIPGDEERSRSPSPSRGHGRRSGSRHRHKKSRQHSRSRTGSAHEEGEEEDEFRSPRRDRHRYDRRRSDISPDHNLRGRPRRRTRSPVKDDREYRKRSTPPSRSHSRSRSRGHRENRGNDVNRDERLVSPGFRRQRSFPNQYHRLDRRQDDRRQRGGRDEGRLGADDWGADGSESGIVYKGRGAMKYRERNRW